MKKSAKHLFCSKLLPKQDTLQAARVAPPSPFSENYTQYLSTKPP